MSAQLQLSVDAAAVDVAVGATLLLFLDQADLHHVVSLVGAIANPLTCWPNGFMSNPAMGKVLEGSHNLGAGEVTVGKGHEAALSNDGRLRMRKRDILPSRFGTFCPLDGSHPVGENATGCWLARRSRRMAEAVCERRGEETNMRGWCVAAIVNERCYGRG